jgi:hypothetical protein
MMTLHSLLAVGPLSATAATNSASLIELVVDLQSDVLWETGMYEIVEVAGSERESARGA